MRRRDKQRDEMIHVKWVLGEFGSVILEGQRVIPRRLLESGFVFQSPDIEKALQSIVGQ